MDSGGLPVNSASVTRAPLNHDTVAKSANAMAAAQTPTVHHLCLAQARANLSVQLLPFTAAFLLRSCIGLRIYYEAGKLPALTGFGPDFTLAGRLGRSGGGTVIASHRGLPRGAAISLKGHRRG
jgi:hypothetical protein